jgi:hypothetical protein
MAYSPDYQSGAETKVWILKDIDKKKPELAIYSHHACSGYVREVSFNIIVSLYIYGHQSFD